MAQTPDPLPVLPGNQRLRFTFRTPVKPTRIVLTDEESYSTLSESYQRSTLHTHLSKRHSGWQLTSKSTIAPGAHEYLLLEFRYKTPCDGSASEESWYYHLVAAVS